MVRLPNSVSGLPSVDPRRPAGACPGRRRRCFDGRRCPCHLRQTDRDRLLRTQCWSDARAAARRRCRGRPAGARRRDAGLAAGARFRGVAPVRDPRSGGDASRPAAGAPDAEIRVYFAESAGLVMPSLAMLPLAMLLARRRFTVRRVPVWYGGRDHDPARASTTALSFANALRTFYSLVYRPREQTARETSGARYFVTRL